MYIHAEEGRGIFNCFLLVKLPFFIKMRQPRGYSAQQCKSDEARVFPARPVAAGSYWELLVGCLLPGVLVAVLEVTRLHIHTFNI
jgi:hypothetical protein